MTPTESPGGPDSDRTMASRLRDIAAICRPHLSRTVGAALVVGTVLFAINHLNEVLAGKATVVTWLKTALTYLVPFLASNYGVVTASRRRLSGS